MRITHEYFTKHVGHPPEDDDLDRCNCELAGMPGHHQCGWNEEIELPVFMAGYRGAIMHGPSRT